MNDNFCMLSFIWPPCYQSSDSNCQWKVLLTRVILMWFQKKGTNMNRAFYLRCVRESNFLQPTQIIEILRTWRARTRIIPFQFEVYIAHVLTLPEVMRFAYRKWCHLNLMAAHTCFFEWVETFSKRVIETKLITSDCTINSIFHQLLYTFSFGFQQLSTNL